MTFVLTPLNGRNIEHLLFIKIFHLTLLASTKYLRKPLTEGSSTILAISSRVFWHFGGSN